MIIISCCQTVACCFLSGGLYGLDLSILVHGVVDNIFPAADAVALLWRGHIEGNDVSSKIVDTVHVNSFILHYRDVFRHPI